MGLSWGDLNPLSWPGQVKSRLSKDFHSLTDESDSAIAQREGLNTQGQMAGDFANYGEGGYAQMSQEAMNSRDYLGRLARGQESVSAMQLQQGLDQNMAAQRSMAASASPANATMAARTAAMTGGRLASGMAGQQAMAGLQERQNAQKALADMIMQQRQQDIQVALGSRQNAISGYGGIKPEGSTMDKLAAPAAAVGSIIAKSDRRSKHEIEDGDEAADTAMKGLRAYTFSYKNPKDGKGKQTGIMAQDLERVGLKHAVIDTPSGKYVHGAKLSTANTAMIARLGARVSELEGKRK